MYAFLLLTLSMLIYILTITLLIFLVFLIINMTITHRRKLIVTKNDAINKKNLYVDYESN